MLGRVVARWVVGAVVVFASGCESTVVVREDGGGGAGSSASGVNSATSVTGSSSSSMWTVPPDRVSSYLDCENANEGPLLFVEVLKDGGGCAPPPDVTDVLVLGIAGWTGQPGTFTVGVPTPQGEALAALAPLGPDEISGTITIEPFVDSPGAIAWDLSVGAGRTDLSVCGNLEDYPCE